MNLKWLIFTLLLLNLPTNTSSQYPSYGWNTTELGVSKGDVFEFNVTEFRSYYSENDSYVERDHNLNNSAYILGNQVPDELV